MMRGPFTKDEREWFRQMADAGLSVNMERSTSERKFLSRLREHERKKERKRQMVQNDDPPGVERRCPHCDGKLIRISQQSIRDLETLVALNRALDVDDEYCGDYRARLEPRRMAYRIGRNRIEKMKEPGARCCYWCRRSEGREHSFFCYLQSASDSFVEEVKKSRRMRRMARECGIDLQELFARVKADSGSEARATQIGDLSEERRTVR